MHCCHPARRTNPGCYISANDYANAHAHSAALGRTPPGVVPPPAVEPPSLRLGTLNYDGAVPDVESDEYMEIVNGPTEVNLAGWLLQDDDGNVFIFPAHTMAPGTACRLYTNEVHPESCGFSFGSGEAIWGNSGDVVLLIDPAGQVADRQCWKKGC